MSRFWFLDSFQTKTKRRRRLFLFPWKVYGPIYFSTCVFAQIEKPQNEDEGGFCLDQYKTKDFKKMNWKFQGLEFFETSFFPCLHFFLNL